MTGSDRDGFGFTCKMVFMMILPVVGLFILIYGGVQYHQSNILDSAERECTVTNSTCVDTIAAIHFWWTVASVGEIGKIEDGFVRVDPGIGATLSKTCPDTEHPKGSSSTCWRYRGTDPKYSWKSYSNARGTIALVIGSIVIGLSFLCCFLSCISGCRDHGGYTSV
jgi:hypothetical protein